MVQHEAAMIRYALSTTDIGDLGLAASERGLVGLLLPHPRLRQLLVAQFAKDDPTEDPAFFADLASSLQSYARGDAITFDDVVLDLRGTPFQLAVWQATRAIPAAKRAATSRSPRPSAVRALPGRWARPWQPIR